MNYDFLINEISEDMYYVYKHTNIFNDKVYIGITCRDPKKRWNNGYGYRNNKYFWRSIQKYGWNEGFVHEILYEDLTYESACQKEIELIATYNSTNPNYGYNHHKGGQYHDYETRQKISQHNTTKKSVCQYSKDGKFINEYESRAAASKATGISTQEIFLACSGRILSAGEYFWCDKDNPEKLQLDLEKYRDGLEHVLQFDLDGNLLFEYKHIYDAAEKTGINDYEIFCACFDRLNPIQNFLFCYFGKEHKIKKWVKQNKDQKTINVKKRHAGKRKPR